MHQQRSIICINITVLENILKRKKNIFIIEKDLLTKSSKYDFKQPYLFLNFANEFRMFLCRHQLSQMNPKRRYSQLFIFVKSIKINEIFENQSHRDLFLIKLIHGGSTLFTFIVFYLIPYFIKHINKCVSLQRRMQNPVEHQ